MKNLNIPLELLIDSGAAISIIKKGLLSKNEVAKIHSCKSAAVQGFNHYTANTLGTLPLILKFGDQNVVHSFHVIDNLHLPHSISGIIGRDFLNKHQCVISFANQPQFKIGNSSHIKVPARCELLVKLKTTRDGVGLIKRRQLVDGVYLSDAIVNAQNNMCTASLLNSNEHEIEIDIPPLELDFYQNVNFKTNQVYVLNSGNDQTGSSLKQRFKLLKENLRVDHLNSEERALVLELCENFHDLFYLPGDQLSFTNTIEHNIPIMPEHKGTIVTRKPYRIPEAYKQEVQKQVEKMLDEEIIAPSKSPWNFPIIVIPKKLDASGTPKFRVVLDLRDLNKITVKDAYPLPNITEILDQLGKATYFSTFDLATSYHQVKIRPEDRCKTAFSTPYGHYEYLRMPFGLTGAPATFQRLMNIVLTGLQGLKCFVYLDDCCVYSNDLNEHIVRITNVFKRFRQHNLKLQPDKCEFLRKEVTYLGHCITERGLKPDQRLIEKVKNFPVPKSTKDVKIFHGLVNYYRRFIDNFSKIAKPLTNLLKKNTPFKWEDKQILAFETLKEKLITPPLLQYPDFSRPFIITTDASEMALGCILSQGEIGKDKPIAYASRTLNGAERNYSTTERELLAIVWAAKQFRPYILGRTTTFVTDHKPLQWVFNVKDPSSRLLRWRIKLEEYDYEIKYKAGVKNTNADALSRIAVLDTETPETNLIDEQRQKS